MFWLGFLMCNLVKTVPRTSLNLPPSIWGGILEGILENIRGVILVGVLAVSWGIQGHPGSTLGVILGPILGGILVAILGRRGILGVAYPTLPGQHSSVGVMPPGGTANLEWRRAAPELPNGKWPREWGELTNLDPPRTWSQKRPGDIRRIPHGYSKAAVKRLLLAIRQA